VLGALGTLGNDAAAQAAAHEKLRAYLQDATVVDGDAAAAAVGTVAYIGGAAEYDQFWQQYKQPRTPQEERRFLFALTSFREQPLIERTLAHALDGEVRTQDAAFLVAQVFFNREAGELAWRFLTEHWDDLLQRLPDNTIMRMVEGVVALSTPELAAEVQRFFAEHHVPDAGKRLDQALERLQIAVAFRQRETESLERYLAQ
jgi:puromycin-sensitive aminopeptidase